MSIFLYFVDTSWRHVDGVDMSQARQLSFLRTCRAFGNKVAGDLSSRRESFVMVIQPAEFRADSLTTSSE